MSDRINEEPQIVPIKILHVLLSPHETIPMEAGELVALVVDEELKLDLNLVISIPVPTHKILLNRVILRFVLPLYVLHQVIVHKRQMEIVDIL